MPGIDIFKYALHENEAFEIEKSYVYQLYFSKRSLAKIKQIFPDFQTICLTRTVSGILQIETYGRWRKQQKTNVFRSPEGRMSFILSLNHIQRLD